MANFQMNIVLADDENYTTARLGDGAGQANALNDNDLNKFVKMIADSQYGLCAVGNEIEGMVSGGPDNATHNGFSIGGVRREGRAIVTLDGLQGTPGTGTIAVLDFVVAGSVTARNTILPGPPKVCKATAAANTLNFKWRVLALYGTGAVGQTALIESLH